MGKNIIAFIQYSITPTLQYSRKWLIMHKELITGKPT